MAINDFLPWATAPGANVQDQGDFVNDTTRNEGFTQGLLYSVKTNKVWRQASFVASATAQMISDTVQEDVLDDGNIGQFAGQFVDAIKIISGASIGDVPIDGTTYGRKDRLWVPSVNRAGDRMTGPLRLWAMPSESAEAANKAYVDQFAIIANNAVQRPGDTMMGPLILSADQILAFSFDVPTMGFDSSASYDGDMANPLVATTKAYVDGMIDAAMGSGEIPPSIVPISDLPPVPVASGQLWWSSQNTQLFVYYDDGTSSQWVIANTGVSGGGGGGTGNFLPLSGGSLSGPLYLAANPVQDLEAATKLYVDSRGGGSGGVVIGDTPPLAPVPGDLWFDSSDAQLTIYYNDGTSSQWVVANNPGTAGGSGGGSDYLLLTGGTLSGPLYLAGTPVAPSEAVNKNYVDNAVAVLDGGTF